MTATTEARPTISETEAARRLNVKPGTLRLWRLKGKLKPELVTETAPIVPGGRPKVEYDEGWINGYVAGIDHPDDDIFVADE